MTDFTHKAELLYQLALESPETAKLKIEIFLKQFETDTYNNSLEIINKYRNQWEKTKDSNPIGNFPDPVERLIKLLFDLIQSDIVDKKNEFQ